MVEESKHTHNPWMSTEQPSRVEIDRNVSLMSESMVTEGIGASHPQLHRSNPSSDGKLGFPERAFSAAGAAFLSAILVNPLDVAKTRLQAQAAGVAYSHPLSNLTSRMAFFGPNMMFADLRCSPSCTRAGIQGTVSICPPDCFQYKGTLDVFYKIVRQEGFTRLWRGTNAGLALAIPTVGIYLPCYDIFRNYLEEFTSQNAPGMAPYAPLVAGSLARSLACTTCYPIELARTRMQAFKEIRSGKKPPGVWKTLIEVISHVKGTSNLQNNVQNYRFLWTGLGAQLARDVPFSAICWSTLEPIRRGLLGLVGEESNAVGVLGANFSAGFVAGSISAAATCPLDVAKTRRQIEKDPLRALRMTTNIHVPQNMMATIARDDSDYDSSCSSITVPDSSRSWMSNLSFGSRSSISGETYSPNAHKPHKANQAAWEAMKRLRREKGGRVGLDHFRLLRRVGSGDIGNVYLCRIRNPVVGLPECFYAMKVVDREALAMRKKLQRAEMEKEILGMLDHPFLPTLYAEFDASHYSCLVMEFCPGGDLHAARQRQPVKRFSISSTKFYAAETLLALEYLHMMGVVYRDLKPENVLVREDGHIMLSDFDLSLKCDVVPKLIRRKPDPEAHDKNPRDSTPYCANPMQPVLSCFSSSTKKKKPTIITTITEHVDHDHNHHDHQEYNQELVAEPINARSKSFVGTHEYLAPEVISGQGHGSAVDWWTFGVFLYELLYGRTPFKGENNEKTLINILKQPLIFPRIGVSTSKEYEEMVKVQDLISKLLVKNPKKRIGSIKGSVEIKRHEFFKGVNWALIRSVRPPEVPSDHLHKIRSNNRVVLPKLSKKERDEPYQIPHHFDYF